MNEVIIYSIGESTWPTPSPANPLRRVDTVDNYLVKYIKREEGGDHGERGQAISYSSIECQQQTHGSVIFQDKARIQGCIFFT
jgi:hypothetical protein